MAKQRANVVRFDILYLSCWILFYFRFIFEGGLIVGEIAIKSVRKSAF